MGCGCFIGYGKSATALAWSFVRLFAGGLRGGLSVGGLLLFLCISKVGLAANVYHRGVAGFAGNFRALSCEGIRYLGKHAPRELARAGAGNHVKLEAVSLSHRVDDDDELCIAWDSGHVPDFPERAARIHYKGGCNYCGDL